MLSRRSGNTKGFSLIELLIALVVLAVGLLGMATLMMTSMKSTQGASQRSAATVAVYDLIERMRSNNAQATANGSAYSGDPSAAAMPACNGADAGCSEADLASLDLAQWWSNLQAAIPGAAATLLQDPAGDGSDETYCIVVFWQEPGAATDLSAPITPCEQAPNGRAFYTLQVTL